MKITYIGHSMTLISDGGTTVLTDPWLGNFTIGIRRSAPLKFSYQGLLHHVDAVLISHTHPDHCDFNVLSTMSPKIPIVVPSEEEHKIKRLKKKFPNLCPISLGKKLEVGAITITAFPSSHPGITTFSYLIEGTLRVFFVGDTLFSEEFRKMAERQTVDIAVIPVVGFEVAGKKISWEAKEAARAVHLLRPRWTLATHFGFHPLVGGLTRKLGSLEDFLRVITEADTETDVLIPLEGSYYVFSKERIIDGGIEFPHPVSNFSAAL